MANNATMSGNSVNLATVEAFLASKRGVFSFPAEIDRLYETRMNSYRQKIMQNGVWPAVIIYNVFLIADYLLLPESFFLSAVLHFAVVTPAIFLISVSYPRLHKRWVKELAAAAIPFLMVAQIMFIYFLNRGSAADQYQYLAVMIVIYMNVNQRFGFRLAVVSTLALTMIYLATLLSGHSPFEVKFTGTCLVASAAYLSLMANRRMEQDVRYSFLSRLRDQLRRESAEEIARHDALTGLANRRRLDEVVQETWGGDDGDKIVAVIMADIDHFKAFNDRYGHAVGDTCLKQVAGALAWARRDDTDIAARLGGEEFLLFLPSADLGQAVAIAERIRRRLEAIAIPHEANVPRGIVTASFGVAAGPVSAHSFHELVASCDAALYAAKRNGRNQVWPPFVSLNNQVAHLHDTVENARIRVRGSASWE